VTESTEFLTKALLSALAAGVILWRHLRPGRLDERRAGTPLALMALAAALAWTNFGMFHSGRLAHRWEQFHYFLGAKYFPEIGYDGLYVASMGAQMQMRGGPEMAQPFLRDLRTNEVRPTSELGEHGLEVRRRFSDARWQAFVLDDADFLNAGDYEYLRKIRLDHGFNPSPLWTAVARIFVASAAASERTLTWLALLDLALLTTLFIALGSTYGSRIACLALVVFGLGCAWRWDWVGGGFLRHDWWVALGLAACALARRRHASAGVLVAYAGLVRVFPFGFLLAPVVVAVRAWRRGDDLGGVRRFALGFACALALGLGVGALAGRGPGAWVEFGRNLAKHERSWLTNNVGAKLTLLYGPDTFDRRLVDDSLPDAFTPWERAMNEAQHTRWPAIAALAAVLAALAAVAAWRAPLDQGLVLGAVVVFALAAPTCYYWTILALVPIYGPFRRSGLAAAALVAMSGLLFLLHRTTDVFERIYGTLSWMLLLGALAWLLPDLRAFIRGEVAATPAVPAPTRSRRQKAAARSRRT
jgi:hypothetical protein